MLVSAELLLYYQRCDRRAFLDVFGNPRQKDPLDDFLIKLRQDSHAHRQIELTQYDYHQPKWRPDDWLGGTEATLELMEQGVECIYGGVLSASWLPGITLICQPDLLVRETGSSALGSWYYVPKEIKFGKRPKLDYQIVSAFDGLVLSLVQGIWPPTAWLLLRGRQPHLVDFDKRVPEMHRILHDCIATLRHHRTPDLFLSRQKCNLCHWYSSCHAIAEQQHHLSLVPGVTPNRYEQLRSMGIETLEALAQSSLSQLKGAFGGEVGEQLSQQAKAAFSQQAIPKLPEIDRLVREYSHRWFDVPEASVEIHFDIEAEPDLDLDFLLGALAIDRVTGTQQYFAFLAETPGEEGKIWQEFLDLLWAYPDAPIYHFCDYEVKTVQRLAKLYRTPSHRWKPVLDRCVDVHWWVTQTVVLPVESYALKPIARWVGFDWRDRNANGAQCICWYNQWLDTGDRRYLDAIVRYNEDDCRATYDLKNWLVQFLKPLYDASLSPSVIPSPLG
ncbi:MAG: TM0106 family RecB-like putative nuclease [Cyanobacteria bacterium SID2]|nr:TM0106 family RecB-like putative nuclease [Cyanobacteria bacterium SID2]MBP0004880.1 TM0106 family RecB-like putative nuclease [Cyanobacteria bacterium SBC]